jgi:inositol-hexakisphosphate/diphosphoinositol-pentakisphosphate 1-kinase
VNLSDAFTFQEKERQNSEADVLEKLPPDAEADALEMKTVEHATSSTMEAEQTTPGPPSAGSRSDYQ